MRKPFQFKEFAIEQAHAAMPVTTDACIFGAIIQPKSSGFLLDIGTGTGLLALMLAQRFPKLKMVALEVQKDSAEAAMQNVAGSPFAHKIEVVEGDIIEFVAPKLFDVIVCNPPFFENQLPSEKEGKRLARHTGELSYETLLAKISHLLAPDGECFLLLPNLHLEKCVSLAQNHHLCLNETLHIKAMPSKEPHVSVIKLTRQQSTPSLGSLVVYQSQGAYSTEMKALMAPFYLKLG